MPEQKQQPKVFLRKPKKSQRSRIDVTDPAAASYLKGESAGSARGVSTSSSTSTSVPPTGPKQPIWYRFRTALTALIVVNAVVLGYAFFRTKTRTPEVEDEIQSLKDTTTHDVKNEQQPKEAHHDVKVEAVESETVSPEPSEKGVEEATVHVDVKQLGGIPHIRVVEEATKPSLITENLPSKREPAIEDQQELFEWILAEKRKVKPANKAEKAQLDAEKALLKDFLRRKSVLDI